MGFLPYLGYISRVSHCISLYLPYPAISGHIRPYPALNLPEDLVLDCLSITDVTDVTDVTANQPKKEISRLLPMCCTHSYAAEETTAGVRCDL